RGIQRTLAIDRSRQTINHAPEKLFSDRNREATAAGKHRSAGAHAMGFGERHQDQTFFAEADHLCGDTGRAGSCEVRIQMTDFTERQPQPLDLDAESHYLDHTALKSESGRAGDELAMRGQIKHRLLPPGSARSRP